MTNHKPHKKISFAPPDISQTEIDEVIDTLKSGWITTGPKTQLFEQEIAKYCGAEKAVCLSSATASLELILRVFDIGEGDEVITTPYTFAATANVILHTGAKPVFVDIKDDFNIDPKKIGKAITDKTKAVIPVDFAGFPADYDEIKEVLERQKKSYSPKKGTYQELFDRPIILADSAHSFGASYKKKRIGNVADFTVFSFHAVKNLTTGEGGAVTFSSFNGLKGDEMYKHLKTLSLHGQSKDAYQKLKAGAWKYDIEYIGYKANMTDISASIGLAQLKRYDNEILVKRKQLVGLYLKELSQNPDFIIPPIKNAIKESAYHIFPLRIKGFDEVKRNKLIEAMALKGIPLNVHFIPVVSHPVYKKLGYSINSYPITQKNYECEVTLPLHPQLDRDDIHTICDELRKQINNFG